MKHIFAVFILAVFSLGSIKTSTAQTAGATTTEDALIQKENDWAKALLVNDPGALDSILADDWVGQYSSGQLTKNQMIASFRKPHPRRESQTNAVPMKVRLFGDVAVVTGITEFKVENQSQSRRVSWTDVFAKRDGTWQCVASQNTVLRADTIATKTDETPKPQQ
jgi:ketosteroid isomerase-like protein